jgi:Leucine-rich repeat (LRR) protein
MAGISLILQNNANITVIDCGASLPVVGGTINLSAFPNLQGFTCNSHGITALSGYAQNANLTNIQFVDNQITGTLPNLSAMIRLQRFECYTNQITGSIPSLSGLNTLRNFNCSDNKLTGSIPSLGPNLRDFSVHTNGLTGSIPSLSGVNFLNNFGLHTNNLTGFVGGPVSNTLGEFRAQNNQLTSAAVNLILASFVGAGRTTGNGICVLNVGGDGNFNPTGQGLTNLATLRQRGWTVTTRTL